MKREIKKRNPIMEALIREKKFLKSIALPNRKREVERKSSKRLAKELPDDFLDDQDEYYSTGDKVK